MHSSICFIVTIYLGTFVTIYVFQALMAKVAQTATVQTKTTECLRMPSMQLKVFHFQNKVYVSDDKMFFQQEVQALMAKVLVGELRQGQRENSMWPSLPRSSL